jgi:hypothetical protein
MASPLAARDPPGKMATRNFQWFNAYDDLDNKKFRYDDESIVISNCTFADTHHPPMVQHQEQYCDAYIMSAETSFARQSTPTDTRDPDGDYHPNASVELSSKYKVRELKLGNEEATVM